MVWGLTIVLLVLEKDPACDSRNENFSGMIKAMIPYYDVLVEGFRPGVLEAMHLSPKELHDINDQLIIAEFQDTVKVDHIEILLVMTLTTSVLPVSYQPKSKQKEGSPYLLYKLQI